jgi:hypothetical protein
LGSYSVTIEQNIYKPWVYTPTSLRGTAFPAINCHPTLQAPGKYGCCSSFLRPETQGGKTWEYSKEYNVVSMGI